MTANNIDYTLRNILPNCVIKTLIYQIHTEFPHRSTRFTFVNVILWKYLKKSIIFVQILLLIRNKYFAITKKSRGIFTDTQQKYVTYSTAHFSRINNTLPYAFNTPISKGHFRISVSETFQYYVYNNKGCHFVFLRTFRYGNTVECCFF